jgi:hypothetical protein
LQWTSGVNDPLDSSTIELALLRDGAANTLALRNGAAAQKFRVYNTYTDASNFERAVFEYGSNQINFGSDVSGSGVHRKLNILGAGIDFYTAGVGIRWSITTAGHFIANNDNQFDIGASGANRPRNVYVGTSVLASSYYAAGVLALSHNGLAVTLGVNTWKAQVESTLLCFSGSTSSFPAFKRVGTDFQVVNAGTTAALNVAAPDADMTFIEDRFRRKGAGSPESAVTAPIGAVYHRTDGGAGTSFYVKESGTGNTGWVGK